MKKIFLSTIIIWITQFSEISQITQILPPGFPDRSPKLCVLQGFKTPPKGYGEVPFYWRQGDMLTRERLEWQLNQLQGKDTSSLQVNYSHLIYNTLANNYTAIPNRYRGSIQSGLIGPVNINVNQ